MPLTDAQDAGTPAATSRPRLRAAAILLRDDALLLVRHVKGDASYWLLPGGGVDFGEGLADSLIREVREETCLTIRPESLVLVSESISPDGLRHIVELAFTAEILDGDPAVGSDPRVREVRFVPRNELRALTLFPPVKAELLRMMEAGFPDRAVHVANRWEDPCA